MAPSEEAHPVASTTTLKTHAGRLGARTLASMISSRRSCDQRRHWSSALISPVGRADARKALTTSETPHPCIQTGLALGAAPPCQNAQQASPPGFSRGRNLGLAAMPPTGPSPAMPRPRTRHTVKLLRDGRSKGRLHDGWYASMLSRVAVFGVIQTLAIANGRGERAAHRTMPFDRAGC